MNLRLVSYLLVLSTLLLAACSQPSTPKEKIEAFTFTNQNGDAYGSEDLHGNVWIANFIFTDCVTVCPTMTAEAASLQEKLKAKGHEVTLISFTVDPEVDTPERLHSFVMDFTNDLSNWHLLTGYSPDDIELFAREQFKTIVHKPPSSNQVIHSSNFYLVDKDGHLIGEYNYIDPTYYEDLINDIEIAL
ncbi:SCO family protein [Sporosarcina ureilytica]|uniref:Cytochrome c oxidase assembly protein n=1 Tax=Sporosarcina ureilytica TaxID=298596 RepID=A0A1D8JK79_9BACL|nr:SCO family protein [Sporosarcina ureilytica]AOV09115.1 cytochrome c oxidase assembly protein [Sporosarcina ureilytica]